MLTMRSVDENGFGQKVRDWNRTEMVERWRERWAALANERLAELDIDARIDDMNVNGVLGSLNFPSIAGFTGQLVSCIGSPSATKP